MSFVRSQADIREVRTFLDAYGAQLPIIAKIERREALANLGGIVTLVDGLMVAPCDLGLDVPLEEVPHIQKDLVRRARAANIPVIVATQMLESMVAHMRPTRAEISDVCTAILDGADAIMLSAETASGRYPVEAVQVMARTAERAEQAPSSSGARVREKAELGPPEAISDAAAKVAQHLKARAIVAFTSRASPRGSFRRSGDVPIVALTPFIEVQRRLALCWACLAPHRQGPHDRGDDRGGRARARRRHRGGERPHPSSSRAGPRWVAGRPIFRCTAWASVGSASSGAGGSATRRAGPEGAALPTR